MTQLDLVNNNVSQFAGRVDYNISPRNLFFARYSFEKGKQGQPLVPYYEPHQRNGRGKHARLRRQQRYLGAQRGGQLRHVFTPTMTNELYATITSFTGGV